MAQQSANLVSVKDAVARLPLTRRQLTHVIRQSGIKPVKKDERDRRLHLYPFEILLGYARQKYANMFNAS